MSDPTPTDRIELASAYVDDALDAGDRVRVETDPELMAMVADMRAVGARVSVVGPAPEFARQQAMAAAMAAFDELHPETASADQPTTPVASLALARSRRADRMRSLLPVGGAVAAAVLVGALVVTQMSGSDNDETQLAGAPAATEAAAMAAEGKVAADSFASTDTGFITPEFLAPDADGGLANADASAEAMEAAAATEAPAEVVVEEPVAVESAPPAIEVPAPVDSSAPTEAPAGTTLAAPTTTMPIVQQLVDLGELSEPPPLSELDAIVVPVDVPLCDGSAIARVVYQGTPALVLRRSSGALAIVVVDCRVLVSIAV